MPCLKILTNMPRAKIPEDFCNKAIPLLVRALNKSAEKFTCVICPDCLLTFGGESAAPGAIATLESIGSIGVDENKLVTKELTAFVQREMGVQPDRFFISFYDIKGSNIGRGGITYSDL